MDARDRIGLAYIMAQDANAEKLRIGGVLSLGEAFADAGIAAAWEKDHGVIHMLFGHGDTMDGVNPGDRQALYYLILALKPRDVLEVGTHIGASTVHIACALKRLGQQSRMTSIDIADVNHPELGAWKKLGLTKAPKEFIEEFGCSNLVEFRTGHSLDFMKRTDDRYDFIFLDGDHSGAAVYQEVCAALLLLKPDGVILLHDYYPDGKDLYPEGGAITGPFRALERIRRENPEIDVLPLGQLPWPTKQGTNVTSLALVVRKAGVESLSSSLQAGDKQEQRAHAASLGAR